MNRNAYQYVSYRVQNSEVLFVKVIEQITLFLGSIRIL